MPNKKRRLPNSASNVTKNMFVCLFVRAKPTTKTEAGATTKKRMHETW